MNREERIRKIEAIDIYTITSQELSEGRTNLEVPEAVMAAGSTIVQLREKHYTTMEESMLKTSIRYSRQARAGW